MRSICADVSVNQGSRLCPGPCFCFYFEGIQRLCCPCQNAAAVTSFHDRLIAPLLLTGSHLIETAKTLTDYHCTLGSPSTAMFIWVAVLKVTSGDSFGLSVSMPTLFRGV